MTTDTVLLSSLLPAAARVQSQQAWTYYTVDAENWRELAGGLARYDWTLLGLWADVPQVVMALRDNTDGTLALIRLDCPQGHYPAVSQWHPPALRLERSLADLYPLRPEGLPDTRPWLNHGRWPGNESLIARHYPFLPVEGDGLHQVPVGPVHAGIIEPGHFRFTAQGETVVRLEQRLGYVHKGTEQLLQNAPLTHAAKLLGRVSGDSTVAYALAFAQAAEAALALPVPPRARHLRALLAELERLANHLGDIGATCNDAAFALLHAHCGILREHVLQACQRCFAHRLMMDCIVPGGVAVDLDAAGVSTLQTLLSEIQRRFPELVKLYDRTASLQDRTVSTGIVRAELARQYGAGGYVGRASGRDFDSRRDAPYPPYDQLEFTVPVLSAGDVDARIWLRIHEVEQSLHLLEQLLQNLPAGPLQTDLAQAAAAGTTERTGIALVEGFRGDVLVWLRLHPDGTVARCHPRDPSWFQWPLLEAAIEGNIVADFPLCNKSFNCSYSGVDL